LSSRRIILAGGTGFIGRALSDDLVRDGHEVVVLTRSAAGSHGPVTYVQWDAKSPAAWVHELEGAEALVNLAGKSVNCRYVRTSKGSTMSARKIR
jgi:NAD dependent epimerase/dehydratase family enzyme